ncbi:MAG: hypothetical protein NZM25_08485 [Leptospiraceae bacterium]|nr:hypothetical protein [Leptospiraceae bacterium]MDW8306754.1 hypothetical protein [Leptospiraceae bacterium]
MHRLFLTLIAAILYFALDTSWAVSPDQTNVGYALRDNRYFIEFINVGVSNFGTEKNVKQFKEAVQHNFNANLWYLQSDYVRAYQEIRRSQELLRDLYMDLLQNRYLEDARVLLDISAPQIIQAKDKHAEHLLRLGYRDVEAAKIFQLKGYNYNRFLYSNKIRYYIDGIKRARRAKRFAFLALIESKTPYEDKKEYQKQTLDDYLQGVEREDITDYERVLNTLTNMLNRRLFQDTYNFILHHNDNYGLIAREKKNLLKETTAELHTEDVSGKIRPPSSEKEVKNP